MLLSTSSDQHVILVERELSARQVEYIRFDVDSLHQNRDVFWDHGNHPHVTEFQTTLNGRSVSLKEVRSVWLRKVALGKFDLTGLDVAIRFAQRETETFVSDFVYLMPRARWVNNPEKNRAASHKLRQLVIARQIGFLIPETLVTNSHDDFSQFYRTHSGKVIYKTLSFPFVQSHDDHFTATYTTRVNKDDVTAESLRPAPCLFQRELSKDYELRVVVVGDEVFAIKIFSQENVKSEVDWRASIADGNLRQEITELEGETKRKCVAITKELGLVFSAIDLVVEKDGSVVFLEANPNGNWHWMDAGFGLPIAKAIADELIVAKG